MEGTSVMNLSCAVLFCVFSFPHSFEVQAWDESENSKHVGDVDLEGGKTYNQLDKMKEPEDENLNHPVKGAFDGDELLTEEQKKILKNFSRKRVRRSLLQIQRWPFGIVPYAFDTGYRRFYRSVAKRNVMMAIRYLEEKTCLKFVNIDSQKKEYMELKKKIKHNSYVMFGTGKGCAAHVGFARGYYNRIFLHERGCLQIGTIIHEIGHAVGFFHTQSRTDRDNYVVINLNNVKWKYKSNFKKQPYESYAKYDYGSVLHYGRKAFARNRRWPTISAKDKNLNFLLGRRNTPSYYDVIQFNTAYGCTDHCTQKGKDVCHNGGNVFKDCSCMCPDGLTGKNCEDIESSWNKDGCSKIITLGNSGTVIRTPNYPQKYGQVKCLWFIKAPTNRRLKVRLRLKKVPHNPRTHTCFHWFEVRYNLMGQPGPRYCGYNARLTLAVSSDNMVMIKFDGSKKGNSGRGFEMAFSVSKENYN